MSGRYKISGLTLGPVLHTICDAAGYPLLQTKDDEKAFNFSKLLDVLNADSYYEIGAGHTYCQDYAYHGQFHAGNNLFYFAVVSDGCSGSADSDLGSRFYARTFPVAAKLAIEAGSKDLLADIRSNIFMKMGEGMGFEVKPTAFDATLVALLYDVLNDTLYTFAWGDGSIFYKFKKDDQARGTLTSISYVKNAPYYLSYQRDPARDILYEREFGTMYADVMQYIVKENEIVRVASEDASYQKFHYSKLEKASEILAFASVFTDGVETYHSKDNTELLMPRHNVYNQLTQYKNTHGEFVERRMLMVKKFCQKENWQHYDDVSAATISFS